MTVGTGSTLATLDLGGVSAPFVDNLSGDANGRITSTGGKATLTAYNSANSTFAGVISDGAGGKGQISLSLAPRTHNGMTLTLTGSNTYTGGTSIAGGVRLQLGAGGATGSIVGNVADAGTLVFDRSGAVTFRGGVRGAGSIVQSGTGALTLTGTNTFSGGTSIAAGTLEIASGGSAGSGAITFGAKSATLKLDATPANGSTFANALNNFGVGDSLDLLGLGAGGATVKVSAGKMTVTSGTISESFRLTGTSATAFVLGSDAIGRLTVTGAAGVAANTSPTLGVSSRQV